jgi:hypothetical protein
MQQLFPDLCFLEGKEMVWVECHLVLMGCWPLMNGNLLPIPDSYEACFLEGGCYASLSVVRLGLG